MFARFLCVSGSYHVTVRNLIRWIRVTKGQLQRGMALKTALLSALKVSRRTTAAVEFLGFVLIGPFVSNYISKALSVGIRVQQK